MIYSKKYILEIAKDEHELSKFMQNIFLKHIFSEVRDEMSLIFGNKIPDSSVIKFPIYVNFGDILIGDSSIIYENCTLNSSPVKFGGGIIIGNNVRIANNVKLITNTHNITIDRTWYCKQIVIKDNAWLGANCTILPGVTIGNQSIIGAGSVVTKDVPDNEVWAGNPAKFIKKID